MWNVTGACVLMYMAAVRPTNNVNIKVWMFVTQSCKEGEKGLDEIWYGRSYG